MKKIVKRLGATACAAVLMRTSAFVGNSAQMLNLFKNCRYIASATEVHKNDGAPKFFVKELIIMI